MSAAYEASADGGQTPDATPAKPAPKKLTDDDLKVMRTRYKRGVEKEQKNREDAREDLNFKVGNQWPTQELRARGDRPALTFDRTRGAIRQVTGDVRQNKPAIKVRPNGDGADKARAEVFAGLIRNIEQQSFAGYVYAQACDNATSCGFGDFMIVTQYADDSSFQQDILLKPIGNALSVVWDPDSVELDKSDAKWCFIYYAMSPDDFQEQYPDAKAVDFEKLDVINDQYGDWYSPDSVRIAAYWCKKPITKKLGLLSDGRTICLDGYEEGPDLKEQLAGATVVRTRSVKSHKVVQHIVSGAEELEDPADWATDDIPIIHVPGEETWVDEKRHVAGLIRSAKDPQRAYNYVRSTSIEVTALQPKAPYMLSAAMIGSPEIKTMWDNMGNTNYPYLVFKSDPNLQGHVPQRVQPPVPATGLMAEAQMAVDDFKAATGLYDASLGAKSNETSGVAINQRKQEGDVSTFVYIDNLALAIACAGRQLVKLIPKVWDTTQVRRIVNDDGSDAEVTLNAVQMNGQGQQVARHDPDAGYYDLSVGKYDVVVEAGPSFTTRRQEAIAGIQETIRAFPPAAPILIPIMAKMGDWYKSDEIAEALKPLAPQPQQGPAGPSPLDLAQAEKTLSDAHVNTVKADGMALDNAQKELQLTTVVGGLQQEMAQIRQLLASIGGPQQQQGGPPEMGGEQGMPPQPMGL